jgi:HAT1-interacting factor 1
MATNEETPITAVEAAVAPETIDTPAAAETTGTTSLVDDIAMAASAVTSAAPTPGTATGTATPFELDEHQRRNSLNVSLADMCAKATALFAQKKFDEAADTYSRATEMQAEMNGEMNPENAEILFLYGRAVFEVGRSKSDVLGNAPAAGKEDAKKPNNKKAGGAKKATEAAEGASVAGVEPEKIIEKAVAGAAEEATPAKTEDAAKNPLLQFEGDEGYDDSDEEMVSSPSSI